LRQNYGQHVFKEWEGGKMKIILAVLNSSQSYFYRGDGLVTWIKQEQAKMPGSDQQQ